MLATANRIPDLPVIPNTTDVVVDISRHSLRIASLIHEYTKLSLAGNSLLYSVELQAQRWFLTDRTVKICSGDLKSRIDAYQKACASLKDRFNSGLLVDTNIQVKEIKVGVQQTGTFFLVCLLHFL